jgi:negative regulator of sigma E activity
VNYERALERITELNGAPADIMFTDGEVQEMEAGRQQQVEAQQMLSAAPVIADTVKTLAEAQNVAGNTTAVI